jgi:hypothetical protein
LRPQCTGIRVPAGLLRPQCAGIRVGPRRLHPLDVGMKYVCTILEFPTAVRKTSTNEAADKAEKCGNCKKVVKRNKKGIFCKIF